MNRFLLFTLIILNFKAFSQRLDFGMEFTVPFVSGSVVHTDYNYLSEDPVSFHFAKVKQKTQMRPNLVAAWGMYAELGYRMFSLKYVLMPMSFRTTSFKVFFPHPELGEQVHVRGVSIGGLEQQILLKYSFKNWNNQKISLLAGYGILTRYSTKSEPSEDESIIVDSEIYHPTVYKYMLWDDRRNLNNAIFGVEFNWLNKFRVERKVTILYSHLLNRIGYEGFSQGVYTMSFSFLPTRILSSFKRNRIYLEN